VDSILRQAFKCRPGIERPERREVGLVDPCMAPTQFEAGESFRGRTSEREECDETISPPAWSGGVDSGSSRSARMEVPL
jgi:hypothetical protein